MNQWKNKGRDRGLDIQDDKIIIADNEEHEEKGEELIDMPRRSPRHSETLVADPRVIQSGNILAKDVQIHHEPELQGGFKALRDKGLRITNYHEDIPK
jgi:hypothetical protein